MTRFLLCLLFLGTTSASGAERWCDPSLPVHHGLTLWLDAARQSQARRAYDLSGPSPNGLLDVCFDGSGNGRHFVQRISAAQPRFVASGNRTAIRFDGKQTFLESTRAELNLKQFTLFVVAAPRSNVGFFRAMFAGNQIGQRDYTSGFNVDLTGQASQRFDRLNVEGKGFGGAVNLLDRAYPFHEFRTLQIVFGDGAKGIGVFVDGKQSGARDREPGTLRIDQLTLGARFYSNEAKPSYVQGFFDGDVAELLLFDRSLSPDECSKIQTYLQKKHQGLSEALLPEKLDPVRVVTNPPPVQVFVPGFRVQQLPLDLPNLNNVRYRADGKMVALAYNGDAYLISDTDGDGIEDKAELFWENKGRLRSPIGMAVTPPGYARGQGIFVASKGKVSLLLDVDGDNRADREVIVASGWKELPHNVDALGVAVADTGKVYFGLGTTDFTNAYLLRGGKAHYDHKGERGAILEVDADFKQRRVFAGGIRFPVGLAFNRKGDLFATDQEGATWLANGNPFDELLHVQRGRHYGFPPRHPRLLPGVIDEPSTFDYAPQHQSTCGLAFNGNPGFGPSWWVDDLFVAGYARGKLYRTQLVKSPAGYVAQSQLFASVNELTIDLCISPRGEMVVATHSGLPDWGNGPAGRGKLFKITYVDRKLPQPVAAWAAGPREVRIAFDRAVDPSLLRSVLDKAILERGQYVRAGDRFEKHRPGYAVVEMQQSSPRRRLALHAVRLEDAGTMLALSTDPHPANEHYALTLPGLGRETAKKSATLQQYPEVDLDYFLSGVELAWKSERGTWEGWVPHLDLDVSRALLRGSASHQTAWQQMQAKGTLTLNTKLDLWQMLRPATQPGSTLDHVWSEEHVVLSLSSKSPFTVQAGSRRSVAQQREGRYHASVSHVPKDQEPLAMEVVLEKSEGESDLQITFATKEDPRFRPLPLRRFLLPWAPVGKSTPAPRRLAELEGGNWLRGRRIFFSDEAGCYKCHRLRGEGGQIGPDLTNLVQRDYASVLRDVREPSAALNPDYVNHFVELVDGRVLQGVPRDRSDGKMTLGIGDGREIVLDRSEIESLSPSKQSLMPEGIDRILGADKLRDLLTFLLTEPLTAASLEREGAPPPRSIAEIKDLLGGLETGQSTKTLRILLVAGPKDHGPGEHDYPLWQRRWYNLLSLADHVKVELATAWPRPEQWKFADVVVFYSNNPGWTAERGNELEAFLHRGGGLVYLHYAVDGHRHVEALADRIGLAWRGGQSRFRHGPIELTFSDRHPLARGLSKLRFVDESYWQLEGDESKIQLLAGGIEEKRKQPLLWTRQHGKGRVFVSILGHYNWTFDDPLFRLLILRGVCWAAGEPMDRLSELITIGARIAE